MDQTPHPQTPPDDERLAALLEGIQPAPGERFHQRMQAAPWRQTTGRGIRVRRRWAAFALAALALVAALTLTMPPLQGMARSLFAFFTPSDSDQIALTVETTPAPGTPSPGRRYPLTVAEASAQAGFAVIQPGFVPKAYQFDAASYAPSTRTVVLHYRSSAPGGLLRISQIMVGEFTQSFGSVGVSADVQHVQMRGVTGEYVVGAWNIPLAETAPEAPTPGPTTTLQADWDPSAGIHMLRWQAGDVLYEIIHAEEDASQLTLDVLLAIAESMEW